MRASHAGPSSRHARHVADHTPEYAKLWSSVDPLMPAGLLRRCGALLYDLLLLAAVLMVVTALFLPFTRGEAITSAGNPLLEWIYRVALLGAILLFFGAFWTRRGQTLGMAAWRLRVEREDGGRLTWGDTLRRLGAAILSLLPAGLGYLWIVVDPQRRAWHDRLSHTRVIVMPKQARAR